MDSTRKQTILYEHFGWDYPEPLYWGRVKIHEFGGFSTSGMSSSIDSGNSRDGTILGSLHLEQWASRI